MTTPASAERLPVLLSPAPRGDTAAARFGGRFAAPITYAQANQINVQVPFELTGYSGSMELEKTTDTGTVVSAAVPVGLANGAPGIFTLDGIAAGPFR